MNPNQWKPEASAARLSVPNTPNPMNARRGSNVQYSAKLAALRGDTVKEVIKQENNDGTKSKTKCVRFMQKNGRCNIKQEAAGTRERYLKDFFTTLVDMSWRNNLLFYIATYLIAWSFFGWLWWLIAFFRGDIASDDSNLDNNNNQNGTVWNQINGTAAENVTIAQSTRTNCVEHVYSYTTAFLFFVETETSIGYGKRAITEQCPEAIILFVIQALLGNVLDAFMIGCIFIKISQPKNRAETLVFSEKCVVSPRDKMYSLMFRVGNLRNSLMVQCRIRAKLVKTRQTQEGEFLALHQDDINVGYDTGADNLFLVTPLIISHEINEKSPFYRMSSQDFKHTKFEIIVILEGMIESTGMICQARTSYTNEEIVWGERFAPVIDGGGKYYFVDHSTFNHSIQSYMPDESMFEFETDLKQNGPKSRFYKYVQEKNIGKFRGNLKNRMSKISRKTTSDTIVIEKPQVGRSKLAENSILLDTTSARRAVSEVNINITDESDNKLMIAMNSETIVRRQYATSTNRDDFGERRWSATLSHTKKHTNTLTNKMKTNNV